MDEWNEEDFGNEIQDEYDQNQEISDTQLESLDTTISQQKEKSDLFNWFWRVTRLKDANEVIRVGNLSNPEIGDFGVSIRDAMNLANLGKIFHHEKFGNYWRDRAVVNSASSMAKQGWFMEMSISQRKIRERGKKTLTPEKWRLFNKKKTSEGED